MADMEALMLGRAKAARPDKWEPLPKVDGSVACFCCGAGEDKSGRDFLIAVGFGSAGVTASGAHIYDEQESDDEDPDSFVTLSMVEKIAAQFPELDWRISMHGPLSGQEYQRQGDHWALVHQDEGFA